MNATSLKRALGGSKIARRLGVTPSAVGNRKDVFPAEWFPVIEGMCADAGIECPRTAFRWTEPAEQQEAGQ